VIEVGPDRPKASALFEAHEGVEERHRVRPAGQADDEGLTGPGPLCVPQGPIDGSDEGRKPQ
jgi:hypothetical protein